MGKKGEGGLLLLKEGAAAVPDKKEGVLRGRGLHGAASGQGGEAQPDLSGDQRGQQLAEGHPLPAEDVPAEGALGGLHKITTASCRGRYQTASRSIR